MTPATPAPPSSTLSTRSAPALRSTPDHLRLPDEDPRLQREPKMEAPPTPFIERAMSTSTPLGSPSRWCPTRHPASRDLTTGFAESAPAVTRAMDCPSAARLGQMRAYHHFGGWRTAPHGATRGTRVLASRAPLSQPQDRGWSRAECMIRGDDSVRGRLGSRDTRPPDVFAPYRQYFAGVRRIDWVKGGRSHRRGSSSVVDRRVTGGVAT